MDLPDCFWVKKVTAHSIDGIGRVSNHPSHFKDFHDLSNQSRLWVFRIYGDDHHSLSFIGMNDQMAKFLPTAGRQMPNECQNLNVKFDICYLGFI
jgi:hypothetical protein